MVAEVPVGQAPQAVVYVPGAAPEGPPDGEGHLTPPDRVGSVARLEHGAPGGETLTRVALFDQGLTQVLQAAVTGLPPGRRHALLLVGPGGSQPLATFKTNPAGAAIVNAVGPIRQLVRPEEAGDPSRRRLAIAAVDDGGGLGPILQVQRGEPGVPGTAASP